MAQREPSKHQGDRFDQSYRQKLEGKRQQGIISERDLEHKFLGGKRTAEPFREIGHQNI
jgi:hypothetical protein